ncbi:hypothetical protein BJV82DRAFT_599260 [Fennellomyces sp. T-0311]|nr:hypothetical protein BJV82DRAFT_599260 [Fennellomyces sp. T-0311]
MGNGVSKISCTHRKRKKTVLDKTCIGIPTDFRHMYHIGLDRSPQRDQRRLSGIPPAEQLRQQLAEITQKLQEITPQHHSHYRGVRRSVTATPIVHRKPPPPLPQSASQYAATITCRRPPPPRIWFDTIDSEEVLSPSKSNLSNEEPLLQIRKENPQHNMSLMKCYVESKIDAQIQKHAYARKRSKSCTEPKATARGHKRTLHSPVMLPHASLPERESGLLSSI